MFVLEWGCNWVDRAMDSKRIHAMTPKKALACDPNCTVFKEAFTNTNDNDFSFWLVLLS